MNSPSGRPVILVSGPRSFPSLERAVRSLGRPFYRWVTIGFRERPVKWIRRRLERFGQCDAVVVTSSEAVHAFLIPFRGELRECDIFAGGSRTAARVRAAGYRHVRLGRPAGSEGIVRLLARERPRRIVYPRSDQAGSALGRRLRGQGHEVLDLIAYRTGPPLNPARHRPRFAGPCTIIVTSPSAVSNLRRELSPLGFQKLRSTAYALVLGVRTARAMRGHGFRDVHVLAGDNTASEGKRPFAGGVFDALQQAERTNA